jgi:phage terminase large subunit
MQIEYPTKPLRHYQEAAWQNFHRLLDNGYSGMKRIAMVHPRRAGKDFMSLQMGASAALELVGSYIHCMPYATSVRKHMWRGFNKEGERIIDVAFPKAIRRKVYESEMLVELRNGSIFQFGGSDNADSLVGGNTAGVIMSELAISNPMAVALVRPILQENGGWIIAPYTPRGKTFGYEFFNQCLVDPNSWAELLTCDDTGHMSQEALDLEKLELNPELFEQEYYCSWEYGAEGAIYAKLLSTAETDGRIIAVPYDPALPCFAAFDLGYRDATAFWVAQFPPDSRPRILHYYEKRQEQPAHFDQQLRALDLNIRELFMPHDSDQHRHGQHLTVIEQYRKLGWNCRMLPQEQSLATGITRGRNMLHRAVFDREGTVTGRGMLGAYKYEYDDKKASWKDSPQHDFSSHGSDAWRYMATAEELGFTMTAQWTTPDYSNLNRAAI